MLMKVRILDICNNNNNKNSRLQTDNKIKKRVNPHPKGRSEKKLRARNIL